MAGSITDRFDAVARAQPDRQAVSAAGRRATYAELASHAAGIAHRLLERGVRRGDRVALLFDHDPAAFAAWLGALRSGAMIVPLLPTDPVDRLRSIIEDAAPRFLLSGGGLLEQARRMAAGLAVVLDAGAVEPAPPRSWPVIVPADAAALLYTSGTSGRPKGVIQTHGNILHRVDVYTAAFGTTPADRFSLLTWYAMAQGTAVTTNALLTGATLCAFDVRREGLTALAAWLVEQRISIYYSVSSLFRSLTHTLDSSWRFPDVRLVRLGGERVAAEDVAAFRRFFPERSRLLVSYASTETGPISMHEVGREEVFLDGVVPVGKVADAVTVFIRDEHGRRKADGEPGEIIVRSGFLSPGYWGQPDLTAQSFANSSEAPGQREYRTGDFGRIRNGLVEHLGRIGNRVQIHGFSVELEEIEASLHTCPDVLRAAVVARPRGDGELEIVAYVQPIDGRSPTVDTLRSSLGSRLPQHMIPSRFSFLDALPLTASGKVDRQRLPEPSADRPTLSSDWAAPSTAAERAVADAVREVLGIDRVGRDDAFLSIGGDSLRAGQVASRLSKRFGRQVSLADLLGASTVAGIAALLES